MYHYQCSITSSNAFLRTSGSYGAEGIDSEYQAGLYHLLMSLVLLEYKCPGGKYSKCSQSSCSPFISDVIQTDPGTKILLKYEETHIAIRITGSNISVKLWLPSSPQPIYSGVTPMASLAARKLLSRVSSNTNENTPSNISTKFSPCSSY